MRMAAPSAKVEALGLRQDLRLDGEGLLGETPDAGEHEDLVANLVPAPSGASRTTPATSVPGVNGNGGRIW